MSTLNRRDFLGHAAGSLLVYSLLDAVFARDAFAGAIKPTMVEWLNKLNAMSGDLKEGKLSQLDWQQMVEQLFAKVDLPDLLQFIDFDRLAAKGPLPDNGARSYPFRFTQVDGLPTKLVIGKQIFGLKEGRSVVPHGHNNMATAFLILKGDFHGRHYDRLEDEKEHIIIRPTIDREFTVGDCSTISDEKDNVHWFRAKTDGAYILNIHVLGIHRASTLTTGRLYLDPNGEALSDERIRARKLTYKEVHELYG